MRRSRRVNRINRAFLRKNMTSLVTKGFFDVVQNDANRIAIQVNLNGVPTNAATTNGVIYDQDGSGVNINNTFAGVSSAVQAIVAANNTLYERRRIKWIKMQFIPKYNNFTATIGDGSVNALKNQPIYVMTDINGLNQNLDLQTEAGIMTQLTGTKVKSMWRRFKVFRRTRSYGYAPKYSMPAGSVSSDGDIHAAGAWNDSTNITALTPFNNPHIMISSFGLDFNAGDQIMQCIFEIKYVWADRKSNV